MSEENGDTTISVSGASRMADDERYFIPDCSYMTRTPEQIAQRAAERRERELVDYRARRARRIAELGLGSHRKEP